MMRALLLVAGMALAGGAANAEDTSDLEGLLDEAVVSTASKSAQSASAAPATSSTITADELRRYGIRTLDQAINFLSLGMVTEDALGTVEIGARGVLVARDYGNHVLVLVDGHAINEPWNGTAYYGRGVGVPLELIDHIEVILGPGSVLYGSNAMLGVINVITRRARDFEGGHMMLESELVNSGRVAAALGHEFTLLGQRAEVVGQVEYYHSSGPSYDFAPQSYGADEETGEPLRDYDWGGRAEQSLFMRAPAAHLRLSVGDLELTLRGSLFERWTPQQWGLFDDARGFELDRFASLDLRWRRSLTSRLELALRGYGDLYFYDTSIPYGAPECLDDSADCFYSLFGASRWAGAEAIGTYDWLADGRLVTMLGVDARVRYASSDLGFHQQADLSDERQGTLRYSTLDQTVGAYLEQSARPWRWLGVSAGARLDADPAFGSHLSPRVAATVSPWEGGHFKAVWAEAFRAPSAYEVYYSDVTSQPQADGLRAERVRSVEASFEQRLGAQKVLLGVFRSWWRDMVQQVELTEEEIAAAQARGDLTEGVAWALQYRNLGEFENYGLNARFEGSWNRLRYGVGLTVARAWMDAGDGERLELPAAASLFGNARLSYDFGGNLPVVALALRHSGRRLAVDADGEVWARPQTEARLTLSGPAVLLEGLSWRATSNFALTDHGPYAVGPAYSQLVPYRRYEAGLGLQYDF